MKIKQSESVVIKRSQINFADYNPRKEARKAKRAERTQMSVDMNAMRDEKNYLIVTFDNMEDKAYICEILNIKTEDRSITALKAFKDLF
jgi:hypothetical protein